MRSRDHEGWSLGRAGRGKEVLWITQSKEVSAERIHAFYAKPQSKENKSWGLRTDNSRKKQMMGRSQEKYSALIEPQAELANSDDLPKQKPTRRARTVVAVLLIIFAVLLLVSGGCAYGFREHFGTQPTTSAQVRTESESSTTQASTQDNDINDLIYQVVPCAEFNSSDTGCGLGGTCHQVFFKGIDIPVRECDCLEVSLYSKMSRDLQTLYTWLN